MKPELVQEQHGGTLYEYYPLGGYIVSAPGVCGGRPTFKHTRVEANGALNLLNAGYSLEQVAQRFDAPQLAVGEAIQLTSTHLKDWKVGDR